jgi:hypothetical protein
VIYLFGLTIFVSSALLFLVEPMIARILLPMLGGTPAVWNTCVVFFQATLFAGYLYTYATTRWLKPRMQAGLHATLWLISIATIPLALSVEAMPTSRQPDSVAVRRLDDVGRHAVFCSRRAARCSSSG